MNLIKIPNKSARLLDWLRFTKNNKLDKKSFFTLKKFNSICYSNLLFYQSKKIKSRFYSNNNKIMMMSAEEKEEYERYQVKWVFIPKSIHKIRVYLNIFVPFLKLHLTTNVLIY